MDQIHYVVKTTNTDGVVWAEAIGEGEYICVVTEILPQDEILFQHEAYNESVDFAQSLFG